VLGEGEEGSVGGLHAMLRQSDELLAAMAAATAPALREVVVTLTLTLTLTLSLTLALALALTLALTLALALTRWPRARARCSRVTLEAVRATSPTSTTRAARRPTVAYSRYCSTSTPTGK
jgi:hypothetical protein